MPWASVNHSYHLVLAAVSLAGRIIFPVDKVQSSALELIDPVTADSANVLMFRRTLEYLESAQFLLGKHPIAPVQSEEVTRK